MYKSSNPTIKNLNHYCTGEELVDGKKTATYLGVALKAIWYIAVTILSAVLGIVLLFQGEFALVAIILAVSLVGAFICSFIASFFPASCPVSGTLYAAFEGFAAGMLSLLFELFYAGIIFAALMATFVTFGVMLTLYATGAVRVGHRFRSFMITALIAICLIELVIWLLSMFLPAAYNLFYGNTVFCMIASAAMVIFASLFILVDLSDVTMTVDAGLEKKYEWRAAFGLTVTLIWLYMEFLRFLAIIASRSNRK